MMQNLDDATPIVKTDNGAPTHYFMGLLQRRGTILEFVQDMVNSLLALNIVAGAGLDGGGTIQAAIDANPVSPTITIDANASDILDLISSDQGTVLYRGAAAWEGLAPGTAGHFLKTNGAAANPEWATSSSGGGTWGPVVDGSFPPIFYQWPDGGIVLMEYV